LGAEDADKSLKEKITTVNKAVIFEHFSSKGRRLPRVYVWGCSETGALGIAELLHPRKAKITGEYWQRNERVKKKRQAPDPILTVTSLTNLLSQTFMGLKFLTFLLATDSP